MHIPSMSISALFRRRSSIRERAACLLDLAVAQSRRPEFYADGGVPDTLDGRFDLLVLHVFLTLQRLQRITDAGETAQGVLDRMFAVLDLNLRELGVQDVGIGRRIKVMAEGFNGRVAAYRCALAGSDADLHDAIRRNAFGGSPVEEGKVTAMTCYVRSAIGLLAQIPDREIVEGRMEFPDPGCAGLEGSS